MSETITFARYKDNLRRLTGLVEQLSIECDAYREVALLRGSSLIELEAAKKFALDDPEKQAQTRDDYKEMWTALEQAGDDAVSEEILLKHRPRGKVN